jgi:hypothetical protein
VVIEDASLILRQFQSRRKRRDMPALVARVGVIKASLRCLLSEFSAVALADVACARTDLDVNVRVSLHWGDCTGCTVCVTGSRGTSQPERTITTLGEGVSSLHELECVVEMGPSTYLLTYAKL